MVAVPGNRFADPLVNGNRLRTPQIGSGVRSRPKLPDICRVGGFMLELRDATQLLLYQIDHEIEPQGPVATQVANPKARRAQGCHHARGNAVDIGQVALLGAVAE